MVVVNPNKKDIQFLEKYFNGKVDGIQSIAITFWVLC